ncbi:amino acid adenylation domain-containing protein [Actinophytocola sediminis]
MRLHELVAMSARRSPDALAVVTADEQVSYALLDDEANRAASMLAEAGVGRGDRVALWLDKSVQAVAAMQGVLRLGAAYVPIDPLNPLDRAAAMIRDCAPRVVLTDPDRAALLRAVGVRAALLTERPPPTVPAEPPPDPGTGDDDLAYILYTSGSTGTPKGVCVSHRNALSFVDWMAGELGAHQADRFANHAPFHFDLSVLDLYVAFRAGASVHLIPPQLAYAPSLLVSFVEDNEITVWYSVPSVLVMMARDGGLLAARLPALRAVIFAGEPYPIGHLRRLRAHLPAARFLNLYGPTETNVCTWHEVTNADLAPERTSPVPIGRACSGDRVWSVRADGTRTAPGEEGELVVAGPTVMLGYWGRPPTDGQPYRTGDRVVRRVDGGYEYLGRRDGMVKLRGHRVEIGEIEEVLQTHQDIDEAVVVLAGTGLDSRLVAFVVPATGGAGPNLLEVKQHCAAGLPRHMIVDAVRPVPELPRTANGKIDRRGLSALADGLVTAG